MVHLGGFDGLVYFMPPERAKPGDTADLQIMESTILVSLPSDWTPGSPLIVKPPQTLQQANGQVARPSPIPRRETESQCWSLEQIIGAGTACTGIIGVVLASAYVGTLYKGLLGFSLCLSFLIVTAGFIWAFEKYSRQARGFNQLHSALLSGAMVFSNTSLGSAFAQAAANSVSLYGTLSIVWVWVIAQDVITGVVLVYMLKLERLGHCGFKVRASFLPWFFMGASSLLTMWAVLGLLVGMADLRWSCGAIHIVLLEKVGIATSTAFLSKLFAGVPPETPMAGLLGFFAQRHVANDWDERGSAMKLLPSIMASISMLCICIVCSRDAAAAENDAFGEALRSAAYALGFVGVIAAAGGSHLHGHGAMLVKSSGIGALAVLISLTLDAFFAERWIVVALAAVASQWAAMVNVCRRRRNAASEAAEADADTAHGENVANVEEAPVADWTKVQEAFGDGFFSLAGLLLLCTVSASRMALEERHLRSRAAAMQTGFAIPVATLACYIVQQRSPRAAEASFHVALGGLVIAAVPYRAMVSEANNELADWVYEISILVYPAVLVALTQLYLRREPGLLLLHGSKARAWYSFVAILLLMCLERVSPVGLLCFSAAAIFVAHRHDLPLYNVALCIVVMQCRGALSHEDRVLLPTNHDNSALHFILAVGSVTLASYVLVRARDQDTSSIVLFSHAAILATLLPATWLVNTLSGGYVSICVGIFAVGYAMQCPSSPSFIVAPLVLGSSVTFSAWTEYSGTIASLGSFGLAAWSVVVLQEVGIRSLIAWFGACMWAGTFVTSRHFQFLTLLYVAVLTCVLFKTRLPWVQLWCLLPGLWWMAFHRLDSPHFVLMASTAAWGVVLTLAPGLPGLQSTSLAGLDDASKSYLQPAGMAWLVAGAFLGGVTAEHAAENIIAMILLVSAGASQFVMGLSGLREGWRRVAGLLSICAAILVGATATKGLVQGLIVLLGSLVAIALAVLDGAARRERLEGAAGLEMSQSDTVTLLQQPGISDGAALETSEVGRP